MRIGELAFRTGVRTSRVRFYEARGLLPPAARSANGYRDYTDRDLKIIRFIERAQQLGFSLREIGGFLEAPAGKRSGAALTPLLRAKLAQIDQHIAEALQRRAEICILLDELSAG